ncbi:MAG: hypothetical protein KIT84_36620 [Labilithrix sp.]|nr:hypothetical protein [Labilithrix sp.]MCW5816581.1 hypothetical protein [Labilithrix sp.]
MQILKLLAVVPVLALGCAGPGDDEGASVEAELGAGASVQFTTSVGAVVVDGKRICTAALVDVDAEAHVGSASLSGRQIVVGGACVGKLRNGVKGVAAFVVSKNGVSLATPILAFDFESEAAAGLAIGVLSNQPKDTKPMKLYGASGTLTGGAAVGTVLRADENGVLVGAGVSLYAGAEIDLVTQCSELHFRAAAGTTVAAGFAASDDGLGAAAIVEVAGELRFAASIDAGCVVRKMRGTIHRIAGDTLRVSGELADKLAQAGQGEPIAVYEQTQRTQIVRVRVNSPSTTIQIGAFAAVSARALGVRTFTEHGPQEDTACSMVAGQCEIRPIRGGTGAPRGFTAGQYVDIEVTIHFGRGHVFIATKND